MFTAETLATWNPALLRRTFNAIGYTRAALEKAGLYRPGDLPARERLAHQFLHPESLLLTACRLFDFGSAVEQSAARILFGGEDGLNEMLKIGLLFHDGDRIRSEAKIDAVTEGWFAFDHPAALSQGKTDYVMGEGNSSKMLSALATGRAGERVLDLGTGAGWAALRLAERGCKVTAVDINPRATGFALFNAKLAGVEQNIEILTGDRFEPVAGRRFDAIISNPPFVISPENTFIFRDGGARGDGFCESLARGFSQHLEDGGTALMILNWFDTGEEAWNERPLQWIEGSGCDAWLFRTDRLLPADYGFRWLRESLRGRPPTTAELETWISYYKELGVSGLNLGFLAMQKRNAENWIRCDSRSNVEVIATAGEEVRQILTNETWLVKNDPDLIPLLKTRFKVAPGIKARPTMNLGQSWEMGSIHLRSAGQLAYDGEVDQFIMRLLEVCASGKTPYTMLEDVLAGQAHIDAQGLDHRLAVLTRELVRHGLLIPPG